MSVIDDMPNVVRTMIAMHFEVLSARLALIDDNTVMSADASDRKSNLTRDVTLSEMKVMHASLSAEMDRVQHAIELDRRVEKLENERAAIARSPLGKRRLGLHRP